MHIKRSLERLLLFIYPVFRGSFLCGRSCSCRELSRCYLPKFCVCFGCCRMVFEQASGLPDTMVPSVFSKASDLQDMQGLSIPCGMRVIQTHRILIHVIRMGVCRMTGALRKLVIQMRVIQTGALRKLVIQTGALLIHVTLIHKSRKCVNHTSDAPR